MMTSSTSAGSRRGTLPRTSRMTWAARSSGRVRLNEPRNDFASGVRELATTTASLMADPFSGRLPRLYPICRDKGETPMTPRAADIVIIGAGAVGCSIAYHLARRGGREGVVLQRDT